MRKIRKNKLGVSLMISYVLLISITVALSIGVYVWLKDWANIDEKINCKEDTGLIINNYYIVEDSEGNKILNLSIKNSGRFNVTGFLMTVGNDSSKIPLQNFWALNNVQDYPGYYDFNNPLTPGKGESVRFNVTGLNKIEVIQIQAYIIGENNFEKIFCESSLIKQEVFITPSSIYGLVSWFKFDSNILDSGFGNTAAISGAPGYAQGELNQAINLNGVDEFVGATISQPKTTIALWYQVPSGDWTHVAYNSTDYFMDGAIITGIPSIYPIQISGNVVQIGKTGASSYFTGAIDEVSIYDRGLSEWEILQLYNSYNITS